MKHPGEVQEKKTKKKTQAKLKKKEKVPEKRAKFQFPNCSNCIKPALFLSAKQFGTGVNLANFILNFDWAASAICNFNLTWQNSNCFKPALFLPAK